YKWWILMVMYAIFVLSGQSVGTMLGRLYFNNGGNSKWMATLVQVVGFPILLPLLQWAKHKTQFSGSVIIMAGVYISLGIFLAIDCMLYTLGLEYLPLTTYTLLCASQLGFNAVFSYFLNGQKLTPYIINSVFLLTISSVLLVFQIQKGDDSVAATKDKYVLGFVSTVIASAGYALVLSLTQLSFQRVIKSENLRAVVDMSIYQSLVATAVIVVGFFGSGEWRKISGEMKGYRSGKVSYVMNLFWTAVSWQVFNLGCIGLVFKVSSLFSNVISMVGLPVGPVLAVLFLKDKFSGLKGVSMALAMWGLASYMYQHYLNDLEEMKAKKKSKSDDDE
ncbi:hypothetical protein M569_05883, partial [Genlisea aurea]